MNRRKSIKALLVGTVSGTVLLQGCDTTPTPSASKTTEAANPALAIDRFAAEAKRDQELLKQSFFTPEEMATITVLADIIIPADEISGSASEAGVPAFIGFIVIDMPEHQVPMRGGLRWLDMQCLNRHEKVFTACSKEQQLALVDEIAYPDKARPEMKPGVHFFNLMRNLTASGFYSTEIGGKDIGYIGNKPNQWNGVPDDVLKQYGLAYSEKELSECIRFDS